MPQILFIVSMMGTLSCVLIAGFVAYQEGRSVSMLELPSTTNTTAPPVTTPILNATVLQQACLEACGAGGTCVLSSAGIATCTQCASGFTGTDRCVDTRYCADSAYCSHADALLVLDKHNALVRVFIGNSTNPVIQDSWTGSMPAIVGTAEQSRSLLNAYLHAKKLTLAAGSTSEASVWFDDTQGFWAPASLDLYLTSLNQGYYASYVTEIKQSVCMPRWRAVNGQCAPP